MSQNERQEGQMQVNFYYGVKFEDVVAFSIERVRGVKNAKGETKYVKDVRA